MKRILPMILSCFYGLIKKFLKIKKTFYAIYQPDLKRKKKPNTQIIIYNA